MVLKMPFSHVVYRSAKLATLFFIMGLGMILFAEYKPILHKAIPYDSIYKAGSFALVFSALMLVYRVLGTLFTQFEHHFHERKSSLAFVFAVLKKGLGIIFFFATLNVILQVVDIPDKYDSLAHSFLNSILMACIGWLMIQIYDACVTAAYMRMAAVAHESDVHVKNLAVKRKLVSNVGTIFIIVITVIAICMNFSSMWSFGVSLLTSATFITAVVGFSAQKGISTFLSGLQVSSYRLINIGDKISIDGESGIIEEITLSYVKIRIDENNVAIIPINYFLEKKFRTQLA